MKFFSLDGPFQKYGSIAFDLMVLTLLWLLVSSLSLGILFPLATAGFLNSINRTIISKDGYMLKSFFQPFIGKFLRNIAINFTTLILLGISIFNIWTVLSGYLPYTYLLPLYIIIFTEVLMSTMLSLTLICESEQSYMQIFKLSFMLANAYGLWSLLFVISIVVCMVLAIIFTPISLFISLAPTHLVVSEIIYRKIIYRTR